MERFANHQKNTVTLIRVFVYMNKVLTYGVGTKDADYAVITYDYLGIGSSSRNERRTVSWRCPYYSRWMGLLQRCYSKKWQEKHPTYKGCTVCREWLLFSSFRKWMTAQPWEGNQLDKDLLVEGNKVYAPENCVFIDRKINMFTIDTGKSRGDYLLGCHKPRNLSRFVTQVQNPFGTGVQEYLGTFNTELEAHLVWKKRKHELACQLADSEYVTDDRVEEALRNRYKNYTIVEDHLS